MKLTPIEEYGLRCLMQLARHSGEAQPTNIRQISEAEGLSTAYVGKLMFLLQKAHLVQATRGVQGGYVLVCNHINHLDPCCLSVIFKRPIDWMARVEFFRSLVESDENDPAVDFNSLVPEVCFGSRSGGR